MAAGTTLIRMWSPRQPKTMHLMSNGAHPLIPRSVRSRPIEIIEKAFHVAVVVPEVVALVAEELEVVVALVVVHIEVVVTEAVQIAEVTDTRALLVVVDLPAPIIAKTIRAILIIFKILAVIISVVVAMAAGTSSVIKVIKVMDSIKVAKTIHQQVEAGTPSVTN